MSSRSHTPPLVQLGRPGATRIGLAVVGYQYPHLARPARDWDANWLIIRGEVECEFGTWAFEEPCLTTWELAELLDWLAAFPTPPAAEILLHRAPPRVRRGGSRPRDHLLRLRLRGEALPPHHDHETRWHTGIELTMRVASEELHGFVEAIRQQLARYPHR